MYAHIEKPKENKSRAVANSVAQSKSNVKLGFGFVDNRQKVRQIKAENVIQRVKKAIKNKPDTEIELDDYKVGELDIYCIIDDTAKRLAMLEPKETVELTDSLLEAGTLPGITGESTEEPGDIYYVNRDMVNKYWEIEVEDDTANPTRGSYSTEKGFIAVAGKEADERSNCAGYALDKIEYIETTEAHRQLEQGDAYTQTVFDDMEIGSKYILAYQHHFLKVEKLEEDKYHVSEKNSMSGVYEKVYTKAEFEDEKLVLDYKIYKY